MDFELVKAQIDKDFPVMKRKVKMTRLQQKAVLLVSTARLRSMVNRWTRPLSRTPGIPRNVCLKMSENLINPRCVSRSCKRCVMTPIYFSILRLFASTGALTMTRFVSSHRHLKRKDCSLMRCLPSILTLSHRWNGNRTAGVVSRSHARGVNTSLTVGVRVGMPPVSTKMARMTIRFIA